MGWAWDEHFQLMAMQYGKRNGKCSFIHSSNHGVYVYVVLSCLIESTCVFSRKQVFALYKTVSSTKVLLKKESMHVTSTIKYHTHYECLIVHWGSDYFPSVAEDLRFYSKSTIIAYLIPGITISNRWKWLFYELFVFRADTDAVFQRTKENHSLYLT